MLARAWGAANVAALALWTALAASSLRHALVCRVASTPVAYDGATK